MTEYTLKLEGLVSSQPVAEDATGIAFKIPFTIEDARIWHYEGSQETAERAERLRNFFLVKRSIEIHYVSVLPIFKGDRLDVLYRVLDGAPRSDITILLMDGSDGVREVRARYHEAKIIMED